MDFKPITIDENNRDGAFKSYSTKHLIFNFLYYNGFKCIRVKLIIIKDFSKVQTFKLIIEKFRKFNYLVQPVQV